MPAGSAKHWCFTLNNYTSLEYDAIQDLFSSSTTPATYAIVAREVGESGTPHLQGYVCWGTRKSMRQCKDLLGDRVHFEVRRGTARQAADYCKKEGDYTEYGSIDCGGDRNPWAIYVTWLKSREERPSDGDLFDEFPHLMARYRRGTTDLRDHHWPILPPTPPDGLREWQRDLEQRLSAEPDDREVIFCVDEVGNSGKSYFARYLVSRRPNDCQVLRAAKRDDLAHTLDVTKSIFLFDVPRGQMEFFQYSIVESIKDCMVFSPKYESKMKYLDHKSHCVVFCNERPDESKLSEDRFNIIHLSSSENNPNILNY